MPADDNDYSARFSRQQMSEIAFSAAIGAAMMLLVGFVLDLRGISDSEFYNFTVSAFTWTMKVGGVLMALVAGLLWVGLRPVLLVDAIFAMAIGVLMVGVGGVWVVHQTLLNGVLSLVFGVIFVRSGWGSWLAYRGSSAGYAFPVASGQDDSSASPAVATPAARQEAMDRLLASKKREASPEPAPAVAKPAPEPPCPPAKVPPLAKNEPPPEGFLAELGREDPKRK